MNINLEQLDQREILEDKIRHHYLRLLDLAKRTRARGLRYPLSKKEAWEIAKREVNSEKD